MLAVLLLLRDKMKQYGNTTMRIDFEKGVVRRPNATCWYNTRTGEVYAIDSRNPALDRKDIDREYLSTVFLEWDTTKGCAIGKLDDQWDQEMTPTLEKVLQNVERMRGDYK